MSFGSDYRDRQRRSRRREQRLVIYAIRSIVTTAALVAIAFVFDVPEKIREKLRKPPPQVTSQAVVPRNEPVTEPREQPPAEESPEVSSNSRRERAHLRRDIPTEHKRAGPPHPPAPPDEVKPIDQAADTDEDLGRRVKLLFDKKRMKILLAELAAGENPVGRVRVIALRELKEKVELAPTDGLVGTDADLQILFPEYPRARILVRTDKIGQRFFLIVEPQMALWADEPMPYTLNKIKSEAFKTRRAADKFVASLAAAKEEATALENWINAPVAKPLAERGRAKMRVANLRTLIKQMEGRVEQVKQGVQQVNALERLARVLHDRAVLQFEVADSH